MTQVMHQHPTGEQRRATDPPGAVATAIMNVQAVGQTDPRQPGQMLPPPAGASRYVPTSVVGQGAMGRVWSGHDQQFGRAVAIKELLSPGTSGPAQARFIREALITANLEHPGVPPVHELGIRDGNAPFYTMQLVQGHALTHAIAQARTLRQRLRLLPVVEKIAQTIAFAHEHGVIHRDIKPDNVLLGRHGETVVLDWGIAKVRGLPEHAADTAQSAGMASDVQTQAGAVVGTPSYMAPEQAAGTIELVDERSDVFALGALLYHVLAGFPPYRGSSMTEVVAQALQARPAQPIEKAVPELQSGLRDILERAMAKAPGDRFQSAAEMAEALDELMAESLQRRQSRAVHLFADISSWLLLLPILVAAVAMALAAPYQEMGPPSVMCVVFAVVGGMLSIIDFKTRGRYSLSPLVLTLAVVTPLFGLVMTAAGTYNIMVALAAPEVVASPAEFREILATGGREAAGNLVLAPLLGMVQLMLWGIVRRRIARTERARAQG